MTDAPEGDHIALAGLDWEQLGRSLALIVPVTVMLRHASIDSAMDYIHPEPLSETDFIKDLFTMPLGEVIEKWYGSRENAGELAAIATDSVIDGLIPGGIAALLEKTPEF